MRSLILKLSSVQIIWMCSGDHPPLCHRIFEDEEVILTLFQVGTGALRIMFGNLDAIMDVIPCDTATNMMIAAGWFVATQRYMNVHARVCVCVLTCVCVCVCVCVSVWEVFLWSVVGYNVYMFVHDVCGSCVGGGS